MMSNPASGYGEDVNTLSHSGWQRDECRLLRPQQPIAWQPGDSHIYQRIRA